MFSTSFHSGEQVVGVQLASLMGVQEFGDGEMEGKMKDRVYTEVYAVFMCEWRLSRGSLGRG